MVESDFWEDIGEGAYYFDEENRTNDNPDEEHPTDVLIKELEEV